MKAVFHLRLPDKYIDMDTANNYRQKTKRLEKDYYYVELENYPDEIFDILRKCIPKTLIWPKFLENLKDVIETYEDLFLVIKDYVHWKVKNDYREARSPFAYFYNENLGRECNSYNGLFKDILASMGFEVKLVGGLILNPQWHNKKLSLSIRHVWVDVKIDNTWVELDATSSWILPNPFSTIRLFNIIKKLKFEIDEWFKKEFMVFIE